MKKPWTAFMILLATAQLAAGAPATVVPPSSYPLSLEGYVRVVLKQSDRSLVAYNNFQNSTLSLGITSRSLLAPSLDIESQVTRNRTDVNSNVTTSENAAGAATLSQPLFLSGGRLSASYGQSTSRFETDPSIVSHSYTRPAYSASLTQPIPIFVGNSDLRSWKRARTSYDIAQNSYRREMQSIESDARAQYYDLLLKDAQLDVELVKSKSSRRAHEITKALVDGGRLPGIELARSNLRLQQDIRRLKNAQTLLQQSINQALQFASLQIDSKIELTSKLDYQKLTINLEKLIETALKHRPDYLAAQRQLELSELDVKDTVEENNLRLSAIATVARTDTGTGLPPDTVTKSWSGGLNLSWPIFNSGITRLRGQSARNNLENARVSFRGFERNIRTQVTNAYLDVRRTEQQLDDLQSSRAQARQSVEAVRIRYQNGRDRLLDVFDSEQQLRDLELEYLNIVISANLAQDRLALLIGCPLTEVSK